MRPNKLKQAFQAGKTVINGWLHIPSTWTAELMAHAGWDSVTVDLQHGLHSMETAIQMLQAISTSDAVPLARVNWNEPGSIMRLLDGGAYGIICPMVNNQTECEAFVGACRYPPLGYRSFGPTRARLYGGADYSEHADKEILTIAMIETKEALDNINGILSVEGLDAIFVGSRDLQISLTGNPGKNPNTALIDEAIDTILAQCEQHGIVPGIWCPSVEAARTMKAKGFRFIAVKSDSIMLNDYASQLVGNLRQIL